MQYNDLKRPGKIGNLTTRNRMIMPAMEVVTGGVNGEVSESQVNYYYTRAEGGAGVIVTEMINIAHGQKAQPAMLQNISEEEMPGLSRIADAIHAGGSRAFMQLNHPGVFARTYSSGSAQPLSPSGKGTFTLPNQIPKIMTKEDIAIAAREFGLAAARARRAGWDGVEIHGSHGYLLANFCSGFYNQRTDEYGGSVENRGRFPVEVVESIKKYAGDDFPIMYKMVSEDYTPGGITIDETIVIAKMLEEAGVHALVISAGALESRYEQYKKLLQEKTVPDDKSISRGISSSCFSSSYLVPHGIYLENAKKIKNSVSIPIVAINSILPEMGNDAIKDGFADFIAFGRQIIADPELPKKIMMDRPQDIRPCLRCNECLDAVMNWKNLRCSVNPEVSKESLPFTLLKPVSRKKHIAIIGGGPAGLQAALTAKKRGHEPVIFEQNRQLGGLLYYVGKPDFKSDFRAFTNYLINQVKKEDIETRLGYTASVDTFQKETFDEIIYAAGSRPSLPNIPGLRGSNVQNPLEVIDGKIPEGETALVLGCGLVGCEVAMCLAEYGKKVLMIDAMPDVAITMFEFLRWVQKARLKELGINWKLRQKIIKVDRNSVICINGHDAWSSDFIDEKFFNYGIDKISGDEITYTSDSIICALGMKPNNGLAHKLIEQGYNVTIIGDADKPRKIIDAIQEGFHAGRRL